MCFLVYVMFKFINIDYCMHNIIRSICFYTFIEAAQQFKTLEAQVNTELKYI
jgi:hypothetical protein